MRYTWNRDEVESLEVDEFLAAIKRSDEDLRWLIEELNARDEPTIVVFFGDHQPGFADWLFEETFGKPVEDANLEEVQARYRTPYFIWANAAARGKYGDKLTRIEDADVTSLNYLSTLLLDATGLPRDSRALYPIGSAPGAARREPERIPGCRGNVALVRRGRGNRRPEDGRGRPEVLRHRPVRPAFRGRIRGR